MAQKSFAKALRQARLKAGLSQSELAQRVGLTGSYISQLESGQRRPLIPRRVKALCEAMGIPSGPLQEAAALERSSPTIRKRIESANRERSKLHRSRDRLLVAALFAAAQAPPRGEDLESIQGLEATMRRHVLVLIHRARGLENLARAEDEVDRILEGTTSKQRDALLHILPTIVASLGRSGAANAATRTPTAATPDVRACREEVGPASPDVGSRAVAAGVTASPSAFFWTVPNDEAYPHVVAGDTLLLDPACEAEPGDVVVVLHGGASCVRRMGRQPGSLRLDAFRPDTPPLRLPESTPVLVVIHLDRSLR